MALHPESRRARRRKLRRLRRLFAVAVAVLLIGYAIPRPASFDVATGPEAERRVRSYPMHRAPHEVRIVDHARDALMTRLAMIAGAERTIDLATFIWRDDRSGEAVFAALLDAARRGVRVRLLGDGLYFLRDPEQMARMAHAHPNIEMVLSGVVDHEVAPFDPGALDDVLWRFDELNRRMHLKLLIVDGKEALLGGRNIGEEYFGMSDGYNFVDRDLVVRGPAVADAVRCFETTWTGPRARRVAGLWDVERAGTPPAEEPRPLAIDRAAIGDDWLRVDALAVWYDRPGARPRLRIHDPRLLADRLADLIGTAERTVRIETPYLILSDRMEDLFRALRDRREEALTVRCLTNSLAATDSWQTYIAFLRQLHLMLEELEFHVYLHRPSAWGELAAAPGRDTCLHGKTIVVDERWSATGTYNFDPRSELWNTELMAVSDDPVLAAELARRIDRRIGPDVAWVVGKRERPLGLRELEDLLAAIDERLLDHLPVDVWALTGATCYEHVAGEPVPRTHPAFHERYRDVGPYPQVSPLDRKRVLTALLEHFGEPFASLL